MRWTRWLVALPQALVALAGPELDVMYLRYKQRAIETRPVFHREVFEYNATLDFKMEFFAVQATPLGEAIVTNVFLCPEANCSKERPRAVADFSRRVALDPGETLLYKFDVELQGRTRTYSISLRRLLGSETDLERIIVQGSTLHPRWQPLKRHYRCSLEVSREAGLLELHLLDQGQTVLAEAETAVATGEPLVANEEPQELWGPPMRRLHQGEAGEFQYPKKYLEFPVPMGTRRTLRLKVISSDGGHFGYYQLELSRASCGIETPLFDVQLKRCVRFCNLGYWADFAGHRCKRCPELCASCLTDTECLSCRRPSVEMTYQLDATQRCVALMRPFWQKNAEQAVSLALAGVALLVFACGALGFALRAPREARPRARAYRELPKEEPQEPEI